MSILIAAVAGLALLCAVNLILTIGVVKRLRVHTALLARFGPAPASLAVGAEVGDFATATVDGEPVDHDGLADTALIAFFQPECGPCREKLPKFVDFARSVGDRQRVLAVVVGDAEDAEPMVAQLRPVARVVVETMGDPLTTAFQAKSFPTVLLTTRDRSRRIVVESNRVDLNRPVRAAA